MFKLVVLAEKVFAKAALKYSTTKVPNSALAFGADDVG